MDSVECRELEEKIKELEKRVEELEDFKKTLSDILFIHDNTKGEQDIQKEIIRMVVAYYLGFISGKGFRIF